MKLADIWSKFGKPRKKERRHDSVVLLLREPYTFTSERLISACEKAWNHPFNSGEDSSHFLHGDGAITLIKCGSSLINLLQSASPYTPPDTERILQSAGEEERLAWHRHTAWTALDHLNDYDFTPNESYATLARLALELLDANCLAIYIPALRKIMLNNGNAQAVLRKLT